MMESNQATIEDAIAQLTSKSLSQQSAVEKVNSQSMAQPTSVMVEESSVEEQQQPKLITVDSWDASYPPQSSYNVSEKQDSAQKTSVPKQQESFNSQTAYTKGSGQNNDSVVTAPLSVTTPSPVTASPITVNSGC